MWPNPNVDGLLHLQLGGHSEGLHDVGVVVYSLTGNIVRNEIIRTEGEALNSSIALPTGTPPGIYIVNLSVDGVMHTGRLVMQ